MSKSVTDDVRLRRIATLIVCLLVCVLALTLAGCSTAESEDIEESAEVTESATAESTAVTFTDDAGVEVSVDNPQRVVACMGSFAHMWELAGGTLVGASDDSFDSFDITSPDVERVGDFAALDVEAIIALEPDFAIMSSGSNGRGEGESQVDLREALEAAGIPVAYFEVTTFEDYEHMMSILCEITGQEDCYQENVQDVADEIDQIVASVPEDETPEVLLMMTYSGGVRVQSSTTMAGDMLAGLGVVNIADEYDSLLSDFSMETVLEIDPDVILVLPMGDDDESTQEAYKAQTEDNPAWATLTAVQEGRFYTLDPELFMYKPCERWGEAYQVLYGYIYE